VTSSGKPSNEFRLTFPVLIRLIIFFILLGLLISYLNASNPKPNPDDPTVLGAETSNEPPLFDISVLLNPLYQQLPESSRQLIENYSNNPNLKFIQERLDSFKLEVNDFPQKQINDLKKRVINAVYQELMKGIN
jgi:hypothetical protein